ncbi:MAG: response regulator [Nitrospirae bacterium]|nr:response regulator [Nitrospirota bacterium]
MEKNRVLTLKEAAAYLQLGIPTIYRLAQAGRIPASKVGGQWRFRREVLDAWMDAYAHREPNGKKTILIVDDEPMIGEFFKGCLEREGHAIYIVEHAREAFQRARDVNPDLVFLDLVMPEKSGVEVFRELRSWRQDLPVVLITGYPDSALMDEALAYGPFMVMKKPLSVEDIRGILRTLFAVSGHRMQNAPLS